MQRIFAAAACALLLVGVDDAWSEGGDLAEQSQNPVGNLISLPFQNSTSFGIGPEDAMSNVLSLKPVYPVSLSSRWNLINRGIVPLIYQEEVIPGTGSASGLGDISCTGYISPARPGKLIWGVGPSSLLPTATDKIFAATSSRPGRAWCSSPHLDSGCWDS